ncbi:MULTISPECIES: nucleotidyltransferase family protein [Thalassotalea]|uniref:nucleotidyltransferase family protein n=1 Tax=Thalassotalea TaxID=1518149 RepID=UPI0009452327|nr:MULTISPECIES: nucleotidyltransferase family protein [Thalassotalea]OKY26281.1 hypothetical protein BI291_12785 [Thalassotalea sp. PP2-459]
MAYSTIESELAVIVLAAGSSSRLGQPKQLVEVQGNKLIARQCELALTLTNNVLVVVGCYAEKVSDAVNHLPVNVVNNPNWQQGMGSSIAAGINALPSTVKGVMLLLVDQWQLTAADLALTKQTWQQASNSIICARGKSGAFSPPIIFPRDYFKQLKHIPPDSGAKAIVNQHGDNVISLSLEAAFADLDTPEQLQHCLRYFQTMNSDLA